MKHQIVTLDTELRNGDYIIVNNQWAEIYAITAEDGIRTSRGYICRTKIEPYIPEYNI